MKKVFTWGMIAILIAIVSCAKESTELAQAPNGATYCAQKFGGSIVSERRDMLAQMFAMALKHDAFASDLGTVIEIERDDDSEVLVEELMYSEEQTNYSNSILEQCYSLLAAPSDLNNTQCSVVSFDHFFTTLLSDDPLVEVGLFLGSAETATDALRHDSLLVTSLPEDYNDQVEVQLKSYTKSGSVRYISSQKLPKYPVAVIRTNERLIPLSKTLSVIDPNSVGDLYFSGKSNNYWFYPRIKFSIDSLAQAIDTVSIGSCDRSDHPTYFDYLDKARFTSQDALRHYESWVNGRPEMQYTIIPFKTPSLRISGMCNEKGWWNGATHPLDIRLFRWITDTYGNAYLVFWTEIDGGPVRQMSITLKDSNVSVTTTIDLGLADDTVGRAVVGYQDPAVNSFRYDIGQMFQYWIQIRPLL